MAVKKSKSTDKMPARKMPEGFEFPKNKKAVPNKPASKKPMGKLVGPAAVEALQKRVSPAGVKKAEMDAKKAIAKKYPGLTKKSK
jgi:hypothetical protein